MIAPAAEGCKRVSADGKLDIAIEVNVCGVFDVHDPAWPVDLDFRRSMHGEGPHRDDPAGGCDAIDWSNCACQFLNCCVIKNAARMCARQHAQRTIHVT